MFTIKCTYLKVGDITQFLSYNSDRNMLKIQHKCELHLGYIAITLHSSISIPI